MMPELALVLRATRVGVYVDRRMVSFGFALRRDRQTDLVVSFGRWSFWVVW